MNVYPSQDASAIRRETETVLRTTLHEHAPQHIDLEHGWAVVSQHMASAGNILQPERNLPQRASAQRRRLPGRRIWMVATAAVLLFALLSAGFASSLVHWFSGSPGAPVAYAAINQSMQISNGIALTATKGYVDPEHLVLYFDAQLSDELSSTYTGPVVTASTIQGKAAKITWAAVVSTGMNHGAIVAPSGGDITGKMFSVTWHIFEVELISLVSGGAPRFIQGNWVFQFSIPFHHDVQDPLQLTFPGVRPIPIH